ncbi:MAG: hypothetical protein QM758_18830 [Armatimonas sp.]
MNRMNREKEPIHPLMEEWVRAETRRQFLRRGTNALGMAALASLGGEAFAMGNETPAKGKYRTIPGALPQAALCSEGQACHLPAHGRRSAADGPVRL